MPRAESQTKVFMVEHQDFILALNRLSNQINEFLNEPRTERYYTGHEMNIQKTLNDQDRISLILFYTQEYPT